MGNKLRLREDRAEHNLCRECGSVLDRHGSRCHACLDKHTVQQSQYRYNLKDAAYVAYGGYKCIICNDCTVEFLCLDHINGGGRKQVKELGAAGTKIYRWLKDNNYPIGYMQVLCYNCNHKKSVAHGSTAKSVWRRRNRLTVLAHYGSSCSCCSVNDIDVLCIDHINGAGQKHRKTIGFGSEATHKWLIDNNMPPSFQILCHNCNQAKSQYGACPHVEV